MECQVDATKKTKSMTIRVLNVKDAKTGRLIHTLKHIHYHAWVDFSTPKDDALEDLMSILSTQADLLMSQLH